MQKRSREESHVCPPCLGVGVAHCCKHPLCPSSTRSVCTEEVIEDGWIEWKNCLLGEIVVVCLDFRALEEVRVLCHCFNEFSVFMAEFTKSHILFLQGVSIRSSNESVELFLLVANSVLFDNNAAS